MALLTIELRGGKAAARRVRRGGEEVARAKSQETERLGRRLWGLTRAAAPIRTGELRRGIGIETQQDSAASTVLRVVSRAKHTGLVIHGRGPVAAIHAKALRFEPGPPGSGYIFRKRVGPARANPFHERALRQIAAEGEPGRTAERIGMRVRRALAE